MLLCYSQGPLKVFQGLIILLFFVVNGSQIVEAVRDSDRIPDSLADFEGFNGVLQCFYIISASKIDPAKAGGSLVDPFFVSELLRQADGFQAEVDGSGWIGFTEFEDLMNEDIYPDRIGRPMPGSHGLSLIQLGITQN